MRRRSSIMVTLSLLLSCLVSLGCEDPKPMTVIVTADAQAPMDASLDLIDSEMNAADMTHG